MAEIRESETMSEMVNDRGLAFGTPAATEKLAKAILDAAAEFLKVGGNCEGQRRVGCRRRSENGGAITSINREIVR